MGDDNCKGSCDRICMLHNDKVDRDKETFIKQDMLHAQHFEEIKGLSEKINALERYSEKLIVQRTEDLQLIFKEDIATSENRREKRMDRFQKFLLQISIALIGSIAMASLTIGGGLLLMYGTQKAIMQNLDTLNAMHLKDISSIVSNEE